MHPTHYCFLALHCNLVHDGSRVMEEYLGVINFIENMNMYAIIDEIDGLLLSRYAYVTNTYVKFLVAVCWEGLEPKEPIIKALFLKIHDEYSRLVLNPFYVLDSTINAGCEFSKDLRELCQEYLSE